MHLTYCAQGTNKSAPTNFTIAFFAPGSVWQSYHPENFTGMSKLDERFRKTVNVPREMIEYTGNNITVVATGMVI